MTFKKEDLATLDKFDFEIEPVAVGYFVFPPDGVDKLELDKQPYKDRRICDMPSWARERGPFYSDLKNNTCPPGAYVVGLEPDVPQPFISGEWSFRAQYFPWAGAERILHRDHPGACRPCGRPLTGPGGNPTGPGPCVRPDHRRAVPRPRKPRPSPDWPSAPFAATDAWDLRDDPSGLETLMHQFS